MAPSSGAITGLTPSVKQRLILEGSRVPAVGSQLTPPEILAAVRAAARGAINTALESFGSNANTFFANPEASSFVRIRPHIDTSVKAVTQIVQKTLANRQWGYWAWVDMSHATITAHTPSVSPVNATMAGLTVSGITLHMFESYIAKGRLYIVQEEAKPSPTDVVLIQQGQTTARWYNDSYMSNSWQSSGPAHVLWSEPVH